MKALVRDVAASTPARLSGAHRISLAAPTSFSYGGVSFAFFPDAAVPWSLNAAHREMLGAQSARCVAEVHCTVRANTSLRPVGSNRAVHWSWLDDSASVSTARARARVRRLRKGRYAASAEATPDASGLSALTSALAACAVWREGGAVLHAACIEMGGLAVLFVGPSGAGKTTACNRTPSARWLALDRTAVVPIDEDTWVAWPMCGGDSVELPRAGQLCAPLAGILRVDRHRNRVGDISHGSAADRLLWLRESMQTGPLDPWEEEHYMKSAMRLLKTVPVAAVNTTGVVDMTSVISSWLGSSAGTYDER